MNLNAIRDCSEFLVKGGGGPFAVGGYPFLTRFPRGGTKILRRLRGGGMRFLRALFPKRTPPPPQQEILNSPLLQGGLHSACLKNYIMNMKRSPSWGLFRISCQGKSGTFAEGVPVSYKVSEEGGLHILQRCQGEVSIFYIHKKTEHGKIPLSHHFPC